MKIQEKPQSVPTISGVELADSIREHALWIRRRALRMVFEAKLGHPGGDLSAADILST